MYMTGSKISWRRLLRGGIFLFFLLVIAIVVSFTNTEPLQCFPFSTSISTSSDSAPSQYTIDASCSYHKVTNPPASP
jgi:hypothetical protein